MCELCTKKFQVPICIILLAQVLNMKMQAKYKSNEGLTIYSHLCIKTIERLNFK